MLCAGKSFLGKIINHVPQVIRINFHRFKEFISPFLEAVVSKCKTTDWPERILLVFELYTLVKDINYLWDRKQKGTIKKSDIPKEIIKILISLLEIVSKILKNRFGITELGKKIQAFRILGVMFINFYFR